MFKNVGSQKLTVIAFADAGHASLDAGEVVTGDSANITMKIEQDDDGTQSASNDTNPTEVEDGQYRFDLTQAETNGDKLTFYPESSTAGVQVVAMPSNVIYTRPQYFPDLGIASDGDLIKVNTLDGHTAQTGDSFARLGAPAGASIAADLATIDSNVDAILVDTGTTLPATLATIDGIVDAILVDTGTTLPAQISALNNLSAAQVNAEVDTALSDIHLDHLLAVDYDPASKPGVATALLNELIENDGGVSRLTANALEQAPSGSLTVGAIADAVWDEIVTGVHTTADSAGALLISAGSTSAVGAGSEAVTLEIQDTGSNPIADAEVYVTSDAAGTIVVAGTLETDAQGEVTFQLDPGTYYRWAQKSGVNFTNPSSFVVS